jgi:hypothetical protein
MGKNRPNSVHLCGSLFGYPAFFMVRARPEPVMRQNLLQSTVVPMLSQRNPATTKRTAAMLNGCGVPVRRMQATLATAANSPDWKEF